MEDDLQILAVEYLRDLLSGLPQILSLSFGDQIKIKLWRSAMKDNLKILKVEYLSSH